MLEMAGIADQRGSWTAAVSGATRSPLTRSAPWNSTGSIVSRN
jgi:hypothetical protein